MIENRISDRAKILLIDEDTSISYLIRRAMEKENYKIYIAVFPLRGSRLQMFVRI